MTTFTIDTDNNITSFPTLDQAEAAVGAGAEAFTSQQELAKLAAAWPPERLVAVWNTLPGVTQVQQFKSAKAAIGRIWARIQRLGEPPSPQHKANTRAQAATGARVKAKAQKKATRAKTAPKLPKKAKQPEIREGSKTAAVVTLLQRKAGATLAEITTKTGWQKHSVRGFIAGAMKKAGFAVESFKPEGGQRTYRIVN